MRFMPSRLGWVAVAAAAVAALALPTVTPAGAAFAPEPAGEDGAARTVRVVAAGDIACPASEAPTDDTCRQAATARLVARAEPEAVLALGDSQYESGRFREYRASYARSWGVLRPRTYPVPGNNEHRTDGAAGYYRYFRNRQPGPPGYYSYRLGSWRMYALNSECKDVDCDAQRRWLRRKLEARPSSCALMYMHRPRFSSGSSHGNARFVEGFWQVAYQHHVDVALAGHEHNYERFRRLDAAGNPAADGIMSFVIGTGGRSLYPFGSPEPGSVSRYSDDFGVLALRLRDGSYRWRFSTIHGKVLDRGTRLCT
ncbi:metallophosphoesterase [soil metagenome]